uniref:MSL complex subunit 1 n=1 Tax=Meleagris gallopavo TaxID=9103 RepID=A0A803XVP5_MELGA
MCVLPFVAPPRWLCLQGCAFRRHPVLPLTHVLLPAVGLPGSRFLFCAAPCFPPVPTLICMVCSSLKITPPLCLGGLWDGAATKHISGCPGVFACAAEPSELPILCAQQGCECSFLIKGASNYELRPRALGALGGDAAELERLPSLLVTCQLLARIERMERRVQLVKKDTEREKHRIFQGFEVDEKAEAEACEKLPLECPQELLEPSQTLQPKHFPYGRNGKGHKRKPAFGSAERKTPVKKLVSEFSKVKGKTLKHSPVKEESSGSLSETVCKRELRSQETPEKNRSLLETPLRPSAPLKGPSSHPKEKGFFSEIDDLPYLSTTEMYLCRWHQPPPSPLPLREPSPKKEETVAIPSWRDHVVEPLRDPNPSDILENLDDSVFSKRHAKLELDEKRRKRWDIQRIREQRILQRLQLRMYKRKGIQESEPEVTSFFPEPDDVESLLITPYLPVVAFGRPLPKLTPQNFELPWLDERSRCRLEVQKKQTPHRTCRK